MIPSGSSRNQSQLQIIASMSDTNATTATASILASEVTIVSYRAA
jgi:hypothetical protein